MAKKKLPLVHSSQLDDRLRRGDVTATAGDKSRKAIMDALIVLALLTLVATLVGKIGLGFSLSIAGQTYLLAGTMGLLIAGSYLFASIRWRGIRGAQGVKVLDKAKGDLQLVFVSILALFTVVAMGLVEVLALVVFLGAFDFGSAGAAFAGNFVLFQAIMLLVYLLALVVRESVASSFQPPPNAVLASKILTPIALTVVAVGVFLATGILQSNGLAGGIEVRQAVYVVTLGVLLEFIAMRIRLRLPSLVSLFQKAVDTSKRANPEMKVVLRQRAFRTYLIATFFVVLSMAFAGAIATGAVGLQGGRVTLSLVIFYVGTALIILGLIAVRVFQGLHLREVNLDGDDPLARMVRQRRRSPQEIFRMGVYGVTGLVAFVCLIVAVLTAMELMPWHKKFVTDAFILALVFGAGPYGFFFNKELKRIAAIDEKFPDFLRDIAESARAGMTLPRALVSAAHGTYGALTVDIRQMAAQVEWGIEFGDALTRFAERVKTPLIDRTVSLVVEAQRAGGNVVDVLTAASEDARELKQIVSERNEQMAMYQVVVYIAFFVFIAVVLVLSAQFIPAFKEAVGAAAGEQVGGLNFKDFDPEDFNTLFFHAALVQAIGGGLVGGVLTRGQPVAGFTAIGVMVIAAWLSFRVLIGVL